MERNMKQEAIDFIEHAMLAHQRDIDTAERKRKEQYESYVTFWLLTEMEAQAHLGILKYILEIVKTYDDPADELSNCKDMYKRRVLEDRMTFSTSQGANLFAIIQKNAYCDYCRNNHGLIDQVLRIYNKQDGN